MIKDEAWGLHVWWGEKKHISNANTPNLKRGNVIILFYSHYIPSINHAVLHPSGDR